MQKAVLNVIRTKLTVIIMNGTNYLPHGPTLKTYQSISFAIIIKINR